VDVEKSQTMWRTRDYDLASLSFDVYVPPKYATAPALRGLLVWLGVQPVPPPTGKARSPDTT
jgi:hypothetical protein